MGDISTSGVAHFRFAVVTLYSSVTDEVDREASDETTCVVVKRLMYAASNDTAYSRFVLLFINHLRGNKRLGL